MRSYLRHPSDIPIDVKMASSAPGEQEVLNNISYGGLSFKSGVPLDVNSVIQIRITVVRPEFEARGKVMWCKQLNQHYEIGIEFLDQTDIFRIRMVEQLCHIEQYKRDVLVKEGRNLSGQEAALEWINKYAFGFPQPKDLLET